MERKFTLLLLCLVSVFQIQVLQAQTPTYAYPQNRSYPFGFQQNVKSKTEASAIADSWYNDWKSRWVETCGSSARVKDGDGKTYSEGIGYGMLLAVYRGDKTLFDGLWAYYKNNMNNHGLMNWCRTSCGGGSCGDNGATDGDLDAAMGLVIASCQWPSGSYAADAKTLITNIKNWEFTTCSGLTVQKAGDWLGGCNCTNPSYFSPGYYRAFAQFVPDQSSFWLKAADDSYTVLLKSAHTTTGLIPAWSDSDGGIGGSGDCDKIQQNGGGTRSDYQFDAARAPWRVAIDYLWWGTPSAKTWLTKLTGWVKSGPGISGIKAGYKRDGSQNVDYRNSAFTGAFALAAMASSQDDANSFFNWWTQNSVTSGNVGSRLDDAPYFQNSLRTIYVLLATGNMWYPCGNVTPPSSCKKPNLGADISMCGSSFPVTLQSKTNGGGNIRFTWKRTSPSAATFITSSSNAADANYSVTASNGAGTYVVVRDSVDGSGKVVCTETDEIVISATLQTPALGADKVLCNPASYSLSPSNLSSFPSGTTWQWQKGGTNINGATSSTLANVNEAATYKLTASISGCASTSDEIKLTSSLPTPVNGCRSSAGTVTLSVTGGTAPYSWYSGTSGGSALATGNTFTTPSISSTTTYYVQDASGGGTKGNVGPANNSIGTIWDGNDYAYKLKFDALSAFTLNSVTVYPNAAGTLTVRVLKSDKTTVLASKSFTLSGPGGSQVLDLGFSIPQGTDYYMDGQVTGGAKLNINGGGATYPYTLSGVVSIKGTDPDWIVGQGWYLYYYNWSVSVGNGCARLPVVATINASCTSTPPTQPQVSGPDNIGQGANGTYTVTQVQGVTYTWSVSGDAQIVSGQGTNTVVIKFGNNDASVSVVASNSGGTTPSPAKLVDVRPAGINDGQAESIKIYPNPSNHEFLMDLSTLNGEALVKVYDLNSNLLIDQKEVFSSAQVTIGADYPAGFYIVELITNRGNFRCKLVKQ
ncbi:glycosyl hydrolase family 8 [Sporocytophaga myxococcoides]|uniref:glycosyl hydrolase family 8 n=1 Tax=Sporocytophaga myxococcoides TaxID=153721 RepID=UPI0006845D7F|nr:glycosyl hydrolase family 8 [Sporocytophaga myxococcoides]